MADTCGDHGGRTAKGEPCKFRVDGLCHQHREDPSMGGRPSTYTQELAETVCRRMCEGESLRSICQESNMPNRSTVLLWVVQDRDGFSHRYAQAMQVRAMQWADETMEIADNEARDWRVDSNGNLIVEGEHIQRSRLRVDTRKWFLSKVLPKVYGDRTQMEVSGPGGGAVAVDVTRRVIDPAE